MWGLGPVLGDSRAPRLQHRRQESTVPCEPQVLWQECPGGILARGGCLGQGASWEPGCLEMLPGVQVGSGAQDAAALPMTKDVSMHFSLLPCLPGARVKPLMGRCSWFGDMQSVPVLELLVCGITPNAGILFSSADLGHLEGAKCEDFCPALSRRSPQVRGAPWQAALLAAFFAFCLGFFLNFLLEYFRV